jgi:hypothetical protein
MFTLNFESRYDEADEAGLREKIVSDAGGREASMTRAYGEAMIRTAGPERMRHLEQRLANDDLLRG